MKKYLLFLVAAMLAMVARAAVGDTFTYQNLKYTVISEEDHTVRVGKNRYASGDISIPSTAVCSGTSYTVTEIGGEAFSTTSTVTSVTIPASVTKINSTAFYDCPTLTSVTIPASVTEIGLAAFHGCSKLESVEIPGPLTKIERMTFYGCRSLTSVTLPKTVTEIGSESFGGCSSLVSINIPASVTKIGLGAFTDCKSLTSVVIPDLVTYVEENTFAYCSSLTSVTLSKSLTSISLSAFSNCTNLTSIVFPAKVGSIAQLAFYKCVNLTTIYCLNPDNIYIDPDAFSDCNRSAMTVYIPKGTLDKYLQFGWSKFEDIREMGAFDIALSEQTIELTVGNTATITATVTKDDEVTVESEGWSSSNPEVATVDNGVITAVAPGEAVIRFTAVDGYGLSHTESCKVTVSESAGVNEAVTDMNASVDVYNLQGVAVLNNAAATEFHHLPAGLYIVRQGKSVKKIIVK